MTDVQLASMALDIRKKILVMSLTSDSASHLGGGLSLVEILTCLYGKVMNYKRDNPLWISRDRFILSKGHGVLAYFATLNYVGVISDDALNTFMKDGSSLIAHPILNLELGIESSNGSLGQGLSFGAGIAQAAKMKNSNQSVYVLMGDGECNEGSVWEAAQVSTQLALDNLIAIIDANGLQSDGEVADGGSAEQLKAKFQSFGWNSVLVDGHDISALMNELTKRRKRNQPLCIVARTTKGKGVSFMENNNAWHHARLTKSNFELAMTELSQLAHG
jgi:transketolase